MSDETEALEASVEALTPVERAYSHKILDRKARRPGPTRIHFTEHDDGRRALQLDGKTNSLAQLKGLASSGLNDVGALFMLVKQLANLDSDAIGQDNDGPANEALAMLDELEPEGGAQAMLAAQMVAVHIATMATFTKAMLKDQTFAGRETLLQTGREAGDSVCPPD